MLPPFNIRFFRKLKAIITALAIFAVGLLLFACGGGSGTGTGGGTNDNITVSFETYGGTSVNSITIKRGTLQVTPPFAPEKAENRFIAWFYSENFSPSEEVNFKNFLSLSSRMTLYAKWESEDNFAHELFYDFDMLEAVPSTPKLIFLHGEQVYLTMTPSSLYEVMSVTVQDSQTEAYIDVTFVEEKPVSRARVYSFEMPARSPVVKAQTLGRVYPIVVEETLHGEIFAPPSVRYSESFNTSFEFDPGFKLKSLFVNGNQLPESLVNTVNNYGFFTLSMTSAGADIRAEYVAENVIPGDFTLAGEFNFDNIIAGAVVPEKIERQGEFEISVSDNNTFASVYPDKQYADAGEQITLSLRGNAKIKTLEYLVAGSAGVPITDLKFIMPESNVTVNATFEQPRANEMHTVTLSPQVNGTISVSVTSQVPTMPVYLHVKPQKGYRLSEIFYTKPDKSIVEITNLYFVMPNVDIVVSAVFERISSANIDFWFDADGYLQYSEGFAAAGFSARAYTQEELPSAFAAAERAVIAGSPGVGIIAAFVVPTLLEKSFSQVLLSAVPAFQNNFYIERLTGKTIIYYSENLAPREAAFILNGGFKISNGFITYSRDIGEGLYKYYACNTELLLPANVSYIGEFALSEAANIEKINLIGVSEIANNAFDSLQLIKRADVSTVRVMPDTLFKLCFGLQSFAVSVSNSIYTVTSDATGLVKLGASASQSKLIRYAPAATKTNVTLGVLTGSASYGIVGDYALYGAQSLMTLTLAPAVIEIGEYAFLDCINLSFPMNSIFSANVRTVKTGAFQNCPQILGFNF
ncbi:MAG: leucine-rich repeat protein, partial [Christensenellaceae bacterium]|nr:leucine-rich repeat protein [Christensenellaceae bacterium]